MRIIGYSYNADLHCPKCLAFAVADKKLSRKHGELLDSESNPVRPIFSTDETDNPHCGDCGEALD